MCTFLMRLAALTGTITLLSAIAVAQQPNGFDCTFDKGTVRTHENGTFVSKPAQMLKFSIGNIDLQSQFASLITPKGTGDLRIVRAIGANHFLEVVTEGFMNITTIYDPAKPGKVYPAVHSRHFGFFGTPIFSQYEGTCRVR